MSRARALATWVLLLAAIAVPIGVAAASPLLSWREPVYIAAGFAGVIAMSLVLVQPLLAGGHLPGLEGWRGRKVHRWTGTMLVAAVVGHVVGLWLTSPPDVIDALLLVSPTPFSAFGVVAMWALFAAATLAALRRRLRLRPRTWKTAHKALVAVVVVGGVVHAMLVEGTMGTVSKAALCLLILAATAAVMVELRGRTA